MERNEMRNKALGISTSSSTNASSSGRQKFASDKENKMLESNIKTNQVSCSPRKSSSQNSNEIVRTSNPSKTENKAVKLTSKKEDADVAVEINITSTQNIQVEVEVAECEIDENGKMIKKNETINSLSNYESSSSSIPLSEHSRKNLKRLGVLYSDSDQISSPIQRTEENFCENKVIRTNRPIKKFSKLAALADDINSWDDDYSHHEIPTSKENKNSPVKFSAGSSPYKNSTASPFKKPVNSPSKLTGVPKPPSSFNFSASPSRKESLKKTEIDKTKTSDSSPKKLVWDKKVIDSLEAQGFSRRESNISKLVYDYSSEKPSSSSSPSSIKLSSVQQSPQPPAPVSTTSIKSKVSPVKKENPKPSQIKASERSIASKRVSNMFGKKDPAEMSLKERMAIFEKNKGKAPVPATVFGIADANPIRSNMPELTKKFDFGFKKTPQTVGPPPPPSANIGDTSGNIKQTVNQLLTNKPTTISEKQISDEIRKQREEDMKCIMSRYNKFTENDDDEMVSAFDERKRRSSNDDKSDANEVNEIDEKRARISPQNQVPARLYPVLSDIETTDSEMDNYTTATVSCSELDNKNDDENTEEECDEQNVTRLSIGREILNTVRKYNDLSNHSYLESSVSSTDVSEAMNDMDEYLNEALGDDDNNDSKDYDDKGSACSDSFEYAHYPASKRVSFKEVQNNEEIPIKSRIEISPAKSPKGSMTLVHTVSFYRRQQSANSANNTPIRKVVHKENDHDDDEKHVPSSSNASRKAQEESQMKIQRLLDEVMRQQAVIKQTSQALNLCASTFEFSGKKIW